MDGIGQTGVGDSDMRIGGSDLQHARQFSKVRTMKEHEHQEHPQKHAIQDYIEHERQQHERAKEHMHQHLERHHKRHHDSQHGHDLHNHHYG